MEQRGALAFSRGFFFNLGVFWWGINCNGVRGANVSDSPIKEVDDGLSLLADGNRLGDVLWVETPFRYDYKEVNKLIALQNDVIRKHCKSNKWDILSLNPMLDKTCYTKHELHLNVKGKEILCSLMKELSGMEEGAKGGAGCVWGKNEEQKEERGETYDGRG